MTAHDVLITGGEPASSGAAGHTRTGAGVAEDVCAANAGTA
ncbi:hypothetical protein [Streptomyces hygroscopicus]|nr:hypothetical protein [Streptomyces hygroscopicus]